MATSDAYLTLVPLPADNWERRAACRGMDPELFFAERGHNEDIRAAKKVCARCVVRRDCLAYAIRYAEPFGVWGGYSTKARRRLVRSLKRRAA